MEKTFKIVNIHAPDNDCICWLQKTPQERLDALETLRNNYIKLWFS